MRRDQIPILILIAASAVGLTLLAPFTWLVLLTDGPFVVAVIAAAAGWGAWPAVWLGFRSRTLGQQVCIAVALGLGLLATATLILGATGLLNRPVAWMLLAVGGVLGLLRLLHTGSARETPVDRAPAVRQEPGALSVRSLSLLLLAPPLVIALFGAMLPPGILWQEEANGYDVLEYHLQAPREYYDAGRISFLPHNVYTSFPQQMEMLYLLLMHLAGGAYAAAIPAQLLHTGCGILAVVALGCWARAGWGRWLVVVLAGSTPWLAFLGCLAYVENGMLFFAAVAAGLVADHYREKADIGWHTALTAGLCAGLAGGCKYTALLFVAAALGLAWLVTMRASFKLRVRRVAVFGLGALLASSPWLVRNAAFTGNPVYPFAYQWFGGKAWSAAQAQQWAAGHRVPAEHDSIAGRLTLAARGLWGTYDNRGPRGFHPALFGQALFVLALAGVVCGRSRQTALLAIWSGLILAGWIGLTFIPGRFAVPLIVPLALLAAGVMERRTSGSEPANVRIRPVFWKWSVLMIALTLALVNDLVLGQCLRRHDRWYRFHHSVSLREIIGETQAFVRYHLLNETLPADAHAWLVGEAGVYYIARRTHYTVPFSRDPWLEFAATGASPQECLDYLRAREVSHIVFSWDEIERLRTTYGFADLVTPAWVARLEPAGLQRVEITTRPAGPAPVEIYELLPRPAD